MEAFKRGLKYFLVTFTYGIILFVGLVINDFFDSFRVAMLYPIIGTCFQFGFPIFYGFLFALPKIIHMKFKQGKWKIDWVQIIFFIPAILIIVSLPSFYYGLFYQNMVNHFMFMPNGIMTRIVYFFVGVAIGYVTGSSIVKTDETSN